MILWLKHKSMASVICPVHNETIASNHDPFLPCEFLLTYWKTINFQCIVNNFTAAYTVLVLKTNHLSIADNISFTKTQNVQKYWCAHYIKPGFVDALLISPGKYVQWKHLSPHWRSTGGYNTVHIWHHQMWEKERKIHYNFNLPFISSLWSFFV